MDSKDLGEVPEKAMSKLERKNSRHLGHRIEINQKSNTVSAPLKSMSSRISIVANLRHQYAILVSSPAVFTAGFICI